MTKGFACMVDGVIDIRSVMDTEIGAMVNGIVNYGGMLVPRGAPDDAVREFWNNLKGKYKAEVVPVIVAVDTN